MHVNVPMLELPIKSHHHDRLVDALRSILEGIVAECALARGTGPGKCEENLQSRVVAAQRLADQVGLYELLRLVRAQL